MKLFQRFSANTEINNLQLLRISRIYYTKYTKSYHWNLQHNRWSLIDGFRRTVCIRANLAKQWDKCESIQLGERKRGEEWRTHWALDVHPNGIQKAFEAPTHINPNERVLLPYFKLTSWPAASWSFFWRQTAQRSQHLERSSLRRTRRIPNYVVLCTTRRPPSATWCPSRWTIAKTGHTYPSPAPNATYDGDCPPSMWCVPFPFGRVGFSMQSDRKTWHWPKRSTSSADTSRGTPSTVWLFRIPMGIVQINSNMNTTNIHTHHR